MKQLKFIGEYRDLKKYGFVFQKLYASNYMQWSKELKGDHRISVWKKGAVVEIDDFYDWSGIVAEYMLANDPVDVATGPSRNIFKNGLVLLRFTIDKKNNKILPYDCVAHESMSYFLAEDGEASESVKAKLVPGVTGANFHEHFRPVKMLPPIVYAVREMFENNLVELADV